MTDLGKERLLALAAHLRAPRPGAKRVHAEFDYRWINSGPITIRAGMGPCGTSGCALGELPGLYPEFWSYGAGGDLQFMRTPPAEFFRHAAEFFDITYSEANYLFQPRWPGDATMERNPLGDGATPEDVAQHIERFVAEQFVARHEVLEPEAVPQEELAVC